MSSGTFYCNKYVMNDISDEQDRIYDDLLSIGKENYSKGYGAIAIAIQKKYILVKRDKKMKIIEVKDSLTDTQLAVLEMSSEDLNNIIPGKRIYLDREYSIREINKLDDNSYELIVMGLG